VGGLAGSIGDPAPATQGTGSVSASSSSGTVIGEGNYVGGLVGLDHGTATSRSFSAGSVSGGDFVGGLEGSTLSQLSNVYSAASVSAGGPVGGLVGENYYGGTIHNAYSTGTVSGSSETGGLVGRNLGSINNSFWDTDSSGITSPTGGVGSYTNSGVTAATTANLESQSFILANAPVSPTWDFTNIWTTDGSTLTPQLIGVANTQLPPESGGSGGAPPSSPPSTLTGGAAGGGSNIVPPALTPQPAPPVTLASASGNLGSTPPPPPFDFVGTGASADLGQENGGLADSTGNSGQVGSGDAAQLGGNGQLNNVANPQAAGVLNQALGPVVYHGLAAALEAVGDWAGADESGAAGDDATGGGDQETILSGGDVAEMDNTGVKNIPPNQAPPQLRQAMGGDVLKGMNSGAGH